MCIRDSAIGVGYHGLSGNIGWAVSGYNLREAGDTARPRAGAASTQVRIVLMKLRVIVGPPLRRAGSA